MLRVVIDTNVFVSALHFGGNPARIVALARRRELQNVTSNHILDELVGVLVAKFGWYPKMAAAQRRWIRTFSEVVVPRERLAIIPDPPDNRVLECALEAKAEYIVSGDRHLRDLGSFQGINIVDPATFLKATGRTTSRGG